MVLAVQHGKKMAILGGLPTSYSSRFLKSLRKTVDCCTFLSIISVLFLYKVTQSVLFLNALDEYLSEIVHIVQNVG